MSGFLRLYRGENDVDFTKWWRKALILSAALVVLSIGSFVFRGFNLGIDFRGGVSWQVDAPDATVEGTRDVLAPVGLEEAKIQKIGGGDLRVQATAEDQALRDEVRNLLADYAGVEPQEVTVSEVGASWGSQLTTSAVRALIVFMFAVFLYLAIRLEWKMAVGAMVAVLHDVIISVGVYSLFQFEVTPPTVIAFLTILGFSIYDTVVVFDKVQENQGRTSLSSKVTYTELMSVSMNQVLLRSLNTSIVSLLPVVSMLVVGSFILGAVTLEEFAVALAVGLAVGVYSSLFVAAPIVVLIKEREPRYRQIRARLGAGPALSREAMTASFLGLAGSGSGVPTVATANASTGGSSVSGSSGSVPPPATKGSGAAGAPYTGTIPPRPRKKGKKR